MRTKQNYKNLLKNYFFKIILISSLLVLGSCEKDKVYITSSYNFFDEYRLITFALDTDDDADELIHPVKNGSNIEDDITIGNNDVWEAKIGEAYIISWRYIDKSESGSNKYPTVYYTGPNNNGFTIKKYSDYSVTFFLTASTLIDL
jgi:hypothetical protein